MPDISKLPELAQLFGVTIDEILGERSELVESAVKEELDDYLKCNTVTPQQLGDVAAILKPEQVDAVFEKTPINGLEEIADLLPFISRDVIKPLRRAITKIWMKLPLLSTGMLWVRLRVK